MHCVPEVSARSSACLLTALSCTGSGCVSAADLRLPSLAELGAESAVIVLVPADPAGFDPLVYVVAEPSQPLALRATLSNTGGKIYVLGYECSGADLTLARGYVAAKMLSQQKGGRPLPEPATLLWRTYGMSDGPQDWISPSELPRELAQLRLVDRESGPGCSELKAHSVQIPGSAQFGFTLAVGLDDRRAVAAPQLDPLLPTRFYVVDTSTTTPSPIEHPRGTARNAAFRAGGELWLLGSRGLTMHGTIDSPPLEEVESRASGGVSFAWLDGPRGAHPFELFAVTDEGTFDRFDGQQWEDIPQPWSEPINVRGGVAWVGPGEAVAVGMVSDGVLRYRDGAVAIESLADLGIEGRPRSVAHVDGLGTIVGTAAGELFLHANNTWSLFGRPHRGGSINGVVARGDGFFFGRSALSTAEVQEYLPDAECEPKAIGPGTVEQLFPFPRGFLAISKDLDFDAWLTIVRAESPFPTCEGRGSILDWRPDP